MELYPVIMAGGTGTRFWPASRKNCPKQFLSIIGEKTMLEETLLRIKPLVPEEHIFIVGNKEHHFLLQKILKGFRYIILEEPLGCNTAPAIGLAAVHLKNQGVVNKPMVVLPADHYVADGETFRKIISLGSELAEKEEAIVTIGIPPTRPEIGYGYLRRGNEKKTLAGVKVYEVKEFVEKPNYTTALAYLNSGEYFWNGGIFIFTPEIILKEISRYLPKVYEGLKKIEESIGTKSYPEVLDAAYKNFPSISIDYGVMEKTDRCLLTIPGDFGWSDVGSWESVYELRKKERDNAGNLIQGKVISIDTRSSFIFCPNDKLVVSLGVQDLLIVDSKDALLVADLKRSQDLRKVVEELKTHKLNYLL